MAAQRKTVTLLEVNSTIRNMKLPAKGVLVSRAAEITQELQQGVPKPFKAVISVHFGDGHAMGMKPITFIRQVMAACFYPELLDSEQLPDDVRSRAKIQLQKCDGGSIGSYCDSSGLLHVRQSVSRYIERRDGGVPCDPGDIYITGGAQRALQLVLKMLVHSEGHSKTGVLVPVPSYIRFNNAVEEQGGVMLPYHLSEEQSWELEIEELQRALRTARGQKCSPRVLYVINPGNPTGQVQSRKSIEEVIRFAAEEKLFLMADEVYQDNVFGDDCEFLSYKKVLFEMGPEYFHSVELTSFNSISKGFAGECGFRCGYLEFVNLDPQVRRYAQQVNSVECCPPTPGQIILDTLMNPPLPGEPSYPSFTAERQASLDTLAHNARLAERTLNSVPGISYVPVQAAMYCFPRIHMPSRAVQRAQAQGLAPDLFYCLRLLEETGVAAGPGSDLGQREGTHHIRFCILIPTEKLQVVLSSLKSFHLKFTQEFS
ncbi:alanine aminotransferase 2-like [Acipenser oxyrinchus oxyrinchus]|uniref:alanine transaminase n=1 Tax=Acipenser oxyrinchus oxyrinchus TaxID=40147 RepID=A0AAD8GG42_ACIOX|nr:alanine aminotransferase 2-like [Acipenser oxyrinchus oxyrinchus]